VLKDELVLIGILVLLVGIASTEAYYGQFGVNYQFLSLSSSHVLYRGLTVLIDAPYLFVPYVAAVLWLSMNHYALLRGWARFPYLRLPLSYLVIMVLLLTTYPLARLAGKKEASLDIRERSCTLPRIHGLITKDGKTSISKSDNYRLLLTASDFVIIFTPLPESAEAAEPFVRRLPKGDISEFATTR
jgi:hypothetical protein